jgi:hypothetical protein
MVDRRSAPDPARRALHLLPACTSQVDAAFLPCFFALWTGHFLTRHIHPITIGGFLWFCLVWAVTYLT